MQVSRYTSGPYSDGGPRCKGEHSHVVEQTEYRLNSRRSIQNQETLMPVISNFEITANRQNRQNRHEGSPPLFLPPFSVILIRSKRGSNQYQTPSPKVANLTFLKSSFGEGMRRSSVGKEFHGKGNSAKRFRPFSEARNSKTRHFLRSSRDPSFPLENTKSPPPRKNYSKITIWPTPRLS